MTDFQAIKQKAWNQLAAPTPPQLDTFFKRMKMLRLEIAETTTAKPSFLFSERSFSVFIPEHVEEAMEIADSLGKAADSLPGADGIDKALELCSELRETEHPKLMDYAQMVFMTHHPKGKLISDAIPSLLVREPNLVVSSLENLRPDAVNDLSDGLEWYREDPFANEHHEHWHVVYPTTGIFDPNTGEVKIKERHGELFFYMHEQMLARYDAERLAVKLPGVAPFSDYNGEITQGYNPNFFQDEFYSERRPGEKWLDINDDRNPGAVFSYTVSGHQQIFDSIQKAISAGIFSNSVQSVLNDLGNTIERNRATVSREFGNLHGMGHILTSYIPFMKKESELDGVMANPATAIRDPFFYQWHKHIDDLGFEWQQKQAPHSFSDRPQVKVRKAFLETEQRFVSHDIYLAFERDVNPEKAKDFDYAGFANQKLGGASWDSEVIDATFTNNLTTTFVARDIIQSDNATISTIQHLVHDEFIYFVRVENLLFKHTTVTVRIFLCPLETTNERRSWIEMDKFVYELEPKQKAVIYRRGQSSSVIKKPGIMEPGITMPEDKPEPPFITGPDGRLVQNPNYDDEMNYCTCGWPYNLLLPKGTTNGMPFRLMIMLTDWEKDKTGSAGRCGSMSFCGAIDEYPDKRGMGYPFDRPFSNSIKDTIAVNQNIACKDITITFNEPADV